jgi:hypothetical protein
MNIHCLVMSYHDVVMWCEIIQVDAVPPIHVSCLPVSIFS